MLTGEFVFSQLMEFFSKSFLLLKVVFARRCRVDRRNFMVAPSLLLGVGRTRRSGTPSTAEAAPIGAEHL